MLLVLYVRLQACLRTTSYIKSLRQQDFDLHFVYLSALSKHRSAQCDQGTMFVQGKGNATDSESQGLGSHKTAAEVSVMLVLHICCVLLHTHWLLVIVHSHTVAYQEAYQTSM